jgi:hypothetical protein
MAMTALIVFVLSERSEEHRIEFPSGWASVIHPTRSDSQRGAASGLKAIFHLPGSQELSGRGSLFCLAVANSKSKYGCPEEFSLVQDFPIILMNCGGENVTHNPARPCHGSEPRCFLWFRGSCHNLGYGLAKLGDSDWPARLADALEDGEAGCLEFRNCYFIHVG